MRRAPPLRLLASIATTAALVLGAAGSARAAESTPPPSDTAPPRFTDGSNDLLVGGSLAFGAAYWAALYVGGTSDVTSDHLMLIPVVGPWLAYGERPPCGEGKRIPGCANDAAARAFLVADGVLQGVGAVLVVVALALPRPARETSPLAAPPPAAATGVHFAPLSVGGGFGVGATAHF